jgi:hypothetical protein
LTNSFNLALHPYVVGRDNDVCGFGLLYLARRRFFLVTVAVLQANFPEHASRVLGDIDGASCAAGGGTLKSEYEAHLSTCSDVAAIPAHHDTFCKKFHSHGKVVVPVPNERFGHVIQMNTFKRFIAKPTITVGGPPRPPRAGFLGPPPTPVLASEYVIAILAAKLGDELIRPDGGVMWCFRATHNSAKPFSGEPLDLFPCRLGLKREKEIEGDDPNWLAFAVNPAPTTWLAPTFADVTWAFLTDWKAGGWTCHAPEFACGAGFLEALGTNLVYSQLEYAAGPFAASWPTSTATTSGL